MHRIEVRQFTGEYAITTEEGKSLYDCIAPLITLGHTIELDFEGVDIFVSNFMSSSLGQLAMDFTREQLNTQLKVENMNSIGRRLLRHVIKNVREQQTEAESAN